jgi:uncharacterized protein (DUF433 family)
MESRIVTNIEILGGKLCVRGTRISVICRILYLRPGPH